MSDIQPFQISATDEEPGRPPAPASNTAMARQRDCGRLVSGHSPLSTHRKYAPTGPSNTIGARAKLTSTHFRSFARTSMTSGCISST